MEYCGQDRLPHSVFLSWDPLDQEKALDWFMMDRSRCPGCGTPAGDWGEEGPGYHADMYRCLGCEQLEAMAIPKSEGKGMRKRLVPGPRSECPRCSGDG